MYQCIIWYTRIIICGLPFLKVSGLREQVRNGFGSKLQVCVCVCLFVCVCTHTKSCLDMLSSLSALSLSLTHSALPLSLSAVYVVYFRHDTHLWCVWRCFCTHSVCCVCVSVSVSVSVSVCSCVLFGHAKPSLSTLSLSLSLSLSHSLADALTKFATQVAKVPLLIPRSLKVCSKTLF